MASLAQQIKSAAKTANSRIRRSGGKIVATGSGVLDSGYFSGGSAKLSTAEKRQRLHDLKKFIKSTDTPRTITARKKRGNRSERKQKPKRRTVAPRVRTRLTQKDIAGWSDTQLRVAIRKEGRTANERLSRIFKTGSANYLPDIYRNLPNGRFDLSLRGLSTGELQLKFLQIREFLSHDYTLKGIEEAKRTMMERMNFGENDINLFEQTLKVANELKAMGYSPKYVDSDMESISEYAREGLNAREIAEIIREDFENWKNEQDKVQNRWYNRNKKRRFI